MTIASNHALLPTDSRFELLKQWLAEQKAVTLDLQTLRVASSDASARRFFRVLDINEQSYIAMDAPPTSENNAAFKKNAALFKSLNLTVPEIYTENLDDGFFLVSDLGETTYSQVLSPDNVHHLYLDAIDALVLLQAQSQADVLPEYDRAFITRELGIFKEWYIESHLGVTLNEAQQKTLNTVFERIIANALAQAPVFMHRDFHSRNLIYRAGVAAGQPGNPGIVDFQDAVFGPITYDLVSLLRDAYIQWDEEMVLDWAIRYWERARAAGLPVPTDIDQFYRDFEWMGLQRHLKILGIFARLAKRDNKLQFLNDIPTVRDYVRKVTHRYVELAPLAKLLDSLEDNQVQVGYTF